MKDCDKNKGSSYLRYWDKNNLRSSAMSQKFPVNEFRWVEFDLSEFDQSFTKSYEGYFLNLILNILKYPFLPERMKIEKSKFKSLVANLHDKTEYVIHIRYLNQALNHGLVLKKSSQTD